MKTSIGYRGWVVIIAGACLAVACGGHVSRLTGVCAADEPAKAAAGSQDDKKSQNKKDDAKKEEGKKGADKNEAEKKEEQADKKKQDASKPANPLDELFKRNKDKNKSRPPVKLPDSPETPANKKPARAAIDPRAPYDKRADDWLRKALAHIKTGDWKEAVDLLQKISDLPEDTLHRTEGGKQPPHWVSMRDEAQRLRGEAPPEILEQYRVQYGGLARQLFAQATRTGDLAGLGRVARTYFHTEAGYEAANRIGSLHLDRGEFALAAYWFAAIWQARPALVKEPLWRAKAAFALKQAGQAELSRGIFDNSTASLPGSSTGLGGHAREAGKWLATVPQVSDPIELALTEWPMFYGSPRRTGVAAGGEPLLLPRWRVATTDRHPVRTQIEHLVEDLADHGTTPLPMLFPTMVAGKIVLRTLHGVQVVDAQTGRLLWQTDEFQPLEKLIAGVAGPADADFEGRFLPGMMVQRAGRNWANNGYGGGVGENSPLCNLLFRNANFGLVSSDGSRLFVADDPLAFTTRQPGVPSGWDGANNNSLASPAARLAAYELETGHPLWEVGGPANGEPFDLPLAGYFFFGAPVADGGDLFVVGESTVGDSSGQIRLICLDPQTGEVKWTQLVAAAEVGIEKDVGRRWWTAQVAVADGLVICPTTVGWLVAVDRATHSLLWGYRPTATTPRANPNAFGNDNESTQMVPPAQLNTTWAPAPPIVVAGRVVYTPADAQVIVCLDQTSGNELWRKPRGQSQFLAGVFDKQAVIVGRDQVAAYRIDDGAQAWAPIKITAPSGRAVTVADRLYLPLAMGPLATGELWSIDLSNGTVAGKWGLPSHRGALGNLSMYQGMLLSADAFGLTAFEQRAAFQNEIARHKRENPRDPWALMRETEIELLARNVPAALAALRQVPREQLPADLRESHRALMVRALTQSLRSDLTRPSTDEDLAELAAAVASPAERHELRSLQADLFLSRGQHEQAFDVYLASADDERVLVARDDAPAVRIRSDLWAAGKIADLRQSLPDEARTTIDQRIAALQPQGDASEQGADPSDQARLRFITLFRTLPQSAAVRRDLAEVYARRGDFLPAENLLWQVVRHADRVQAADRAQAADALERLARLMVEYKLPADAAWNYDLLERRFGDVALPAGGTGSDLVKALRDSGKFPDYPPSVLEWQADAVRVERIGAGNSNQMTQELLSLGSSAPFFARHRFEVDLSAQRLEVVDGMDDDMHWSLPLRGKAGAVETGFTSAQASGHQLTLLSRGMLHCLSPVDRKVLWTRPVENRGPGQHYSGQHYSGQNYFGRSPTAVQPMIKSISLVGRHQGLAASSAASGTLSLVNEQFVAFQGRRNLTLLDAPSGEVCWVYTGVRPGTLVLGGGEVIYVRQSDGPNPVAPFALRVSDGRRVEIKNLAETLNRAVHAVGDNFVLTTLADGKPGLRLFDPVRERDLWAVELRRDTVMTMLENDRLALLEPEPKPAARSNREPANGQPANGQPANGQPADGKPVGSPGAKFAVIDLANGRRQELATIAADDLKARNEVYVVADNDSLFLLINKGQNLNYYAEQVPSVRVNGVMLAFDPASGKQRWRQPVLDQNLMLERLAFSPYLVFSRRKSEQKGRMPVWSLQMLVLDKQSGAKLLDEKSFSQPGFRSMTISTADRYIELRSYQERVRLYPVDKSASAGQSGG